MPRAMRAYTEPIDKPSRMYWRRSFTVSRCLGPEVGAANRIVVGDRRGCTCRHDPARFQQAHVVGDVERQVGVLLDEQHGQAALLVESLDNLEQLLGDDRGEAETRLVAQ